MNLLILLVSLLVYAGSGLWGLAYLAFATVTGYVLGLMIPKKRWLLWVGIGLNGGVLVLMKLQGLLGLQLPTVLGISYFSLQLMAYLTDVYQQKQTPEKNFFRFSLFFTYLPRLYIGPIEKYDPSLFQNRRITREGLWAGAGRALWGGFKKLVIAARVGVIISAISAEPAYNGAYALAAMLLYSIQLYADFSGGIDLVLGISRMLGLQLTENFDAPFLSQSFQEFWRRWHISLGAWLREYIYIPLGGNRKGKVRKVINLIVTFLVSGLWHGVQYLLWGLFNGIFVAFGSKLQTKWKTLNRIGTFLLISLLWCFFVWPDALTAGKMLLSVFTTFNYGSFFETLPTLGLTLGDWVVLGVATLALFVYDGNRKAISTRLCATPLWVQTAGICLMALLVLVFGMYGIGFDAQAFIYSRF